MRQTLRGALLRSLICTALGYSVFQLWAMQSALAQDSTELHSCNGIFTNKPCEEVAADLESPLRTPAVKPTLRPTVLPAATTKPPTLPNTPSGKAAVQATAIATNYPEALPPQPVMVDAKATAISKSKKDSSLHNLRMKLIKGRRSVGIDLDISSAVDVCTSRTTSVEECRNVVSELDATLEERINTAKLTKIAEEKAKIEATTAAKSQQNQSTVVIVQPNIRATPTPFFIFDTGPLLPVDPSYRRPSRGGHHHGDHPGVRPPPLPIPPPPAGGAIIDTVPRKKQR